MGKDRWEEQARKPARTNGKPQRAKQSTRDEIVSLHPTKEEAVEIARMTGELLENLGIISDYVESGCRAYWGPSVRTNSQYLILKPPETGGDEPPSLAVFHTDVAKMVAGMAFLLTVKHKEWPTSIVGQWSLNPDW